MRALIVLEKICLVNIVFKWVTPFEAVCIHYVQEFFQNISIYIPKYSNWTIIFCDSHFKSHFQCTVECWQSNYRLNCVTHRYVGVEFASVEQTYYDIDCHCTYFGRFTLPFGVINRLLSIHILMNWNKLHNWTLWFDHVVLNRIKKSYSSWKKKKFLQKKMSTNGNMICRIKYAWW